MSGSTDKAAAPEMLQGCAPGIMRPTPQRTNRPTMTGAACKDVCCSYSLTAITASQGQQNPSGTSLTVAAIAGRCCRPVHAPPVGGDGQQVQAVALAGRDGGHVHHGRALAVAAWEGTDKFSNGSANDLPERMGEAQLGNHHAWHLRGRRCPVCPAQALPPSSGMLCEFCSSSAAKRNGGRSAAAGFAPPRPKTSRPPSTRAVAAACL